MSFHTYLLLFFLFYSEPEGLQVGDVAPDFAGVDQLGNPVTLEDALSKGPVVLTFFRGSWCRYCMKQMKDYQDSLALFSQQKATLIAVTPEKEAGIAKTADLANATFSIIHDDNLTIMDRYRVISKEKVEEYRNAYANLKADNSKKFLPVPATYIIGQDRKISFVYFDPNYKVRISNRILLDHLSSRD